MRGAFTLLDLSGKAVVEYSYDAWGNHSVSGSNLSLGRLNPFRYRGYYYDGETGLYYLQTRYYDPELCRFITIDSTEYLDPETINGLNLYAYCANNPVMFTDLNGCSWNDFWTGVKNWFKNAGTAIKNFFVNNSYIGISGPSVNFAIRAELTGEHNFFNFTLPNINMQKRLYGIGSLKGIFDDPIRYFNYIFFNNVVPNFIINTVWNDWIVDKLWNGFIVPKWREIIDGISALFSIGSGVVGVLSAFGIISIPIVGEVVLGLVSIGFGIYAIGRIFKWW